MVRSDREVKRCLVILNRNTSKVHCNITIITFAEHYCSFKAMRVTLRSTACFMLPHFFSGQYCTSTPINFYIVFIYYF